MALARCEGCGQPVRRTNRYVARVRPVGYPESGLVCGRAGCEGTAFIWLNVFEANLYRSGRRVLELQNNVVKVRLQEGAEFLEERAEPFRAKS
jgi:hypothetical protein